MYCRNIIQEHMIPLMSQINIITGGYDSNCPSSHGLLYKSQIIKRTSVKHKYIYIADRDLFERLLFLRPTTLKMSSTPIYSDNEEP